MGLKAFVFGPLVGPTRWAHPLGREKKRQRTLQRMRYFIEAGDRWYSFLILNRIGRAARLPRGLPSG